MGKTYYRIEWEVPSRNAIGYKSFWSGVEYIKDDGDGKAFERLDWWRKEQPEDNFRIVKIVEYVLGAF